jgi:hypothetical protein
MATYATALFMMCMGSTPLFSQPSPAKAIVRLPAAVLNDVLDRRLDSLDIQGYKAGNVPVTVYWSDVTIDTAMGMLWMAGTVVQSIDGMPLAGVRLAAGNLEQRGDEYRFDVHAGTVADENGRFSFSWRLDEKDVLIVSMLGHLEAVWPIGTLRALRPQPLLEAR